MKVNRSTIKYSLQKMLPKQLFNIVMFIWRNILLHGVERIDTLRLKSFSKKQTVTLTHRGVSFSLLLNPENGFIDKHIFLYGVYEPFILDLFAKILTPGMTFIDIGANIGQHSMYAAKLVGRNGAVYAFEPIPKIYNQLQQSASINTYSHLKAYNTALGEMNKQETLHLSTVNIGGSSIVEKTNAGSSLAITVSVGDELLKGVHPDLIKIDVEGYELEVLSGIKNLLAKTQPYIIIEFSGESYHQQGNNHGTRILELLSSLNYTCYDIEDAMKQISNPAAFLAMFPDKRKQTNLLCVPKGKPVIV